MTQKIYSQKGYALNETERLELARLLIKSGYTVRIGRERPAGKSGTYAHFVEYSDADGL